MTVLLNRPYQGYPSGAVVQLASQEEASLIAQGLAFNSTAVPTSGPQSTTNTRGRGTIAAASNNLVVNNPLITPESKVYAVIAQATADGTALYVARIVPAAGFATIYVNANATAATVVDWTLLTVSGMLPPN